MKTCSVRRLLSVVVFCVMCWPALASAGDGARLLPNELRAAGGLGRFDRTWLVAAVFHSNTPRFLRAHRVEVATGLNGSGNRARPFVSAGPVWRIGMPRRLFVELGFSPTLLGGSSFQGTDLGGNFHFTSSAAIGRDLGRGRLIALRIQHTSNGSIRRVNPGINMAGLSITFASFRNSESTRSGDW